MSTATVSALVSRLRRQGVMLWADGEFLAYDTPAGAMTEDMRSALVDCKADVLALLRAEGYKPPGDRIATVARCEWASWAALVVDLVTTEAELQLDVMFVFNERAGVLEYEGSHTRQEAEREALAAALGELTAHPKHRPRAGFAEALAGRPATTKPPPEPYQPGFR